MYRYKWSVVILNVFQQKSQEINENGTTVPYIKSICSRLHCEMKKVSYVIKISTWSKLNTLFLTLFFRFRIPSKLTELLISLNFNGATQCPIKVLHTRFH